MIVTSKGREPRATSLEVSTTPVSTVWDGRYHCPAVGGFVSTVKQKVVFDRETENGWLRISGHESFDAASTWAQIRAVHDEGYADSVCSGERKGTNQSEGFRWAPEFPESACIWSWHVAAWRPALEQGLVFHPVSNAQHARRATDGGFLVGAPPCPASFDEGWLEEVTAVELDTLQGKRLVGARRGRCEVLGLRSFQC